MHCVIGSGPAGVACAKALLARGASVPAMLDAGLELEPNRARIVRELSGKNPPAPIPWPRFKRRRGRRCYRVAAETPGFGSDFPYRENH